LAKRNENDPTSYPIPTPNTIPKCSFDGALSSSAHAPKRLSLKEATRSLQRSLIQQTLAEHGGNWAAAARALGMHRSNLHHLAVRWGLK